MTPERLAEIRKIASVSGEPYLIAALLAHVDELYQQLADARRIAIDSGVFQDHRGEDYDLDSDARGDQWCADPVGPVAWDAQVEQR